MAPISITLRARLAAHESWARTEDRAARTAPATKASPASVDYWEAKVDPDGQMTPEQRRQAAESARKAHMTRLAMASARKRAAKTETAS